MAAKSKLDLKALRKQLEQRRSQLLDTTELTSSDRRPVELDQSMQGRLSRIDALQQREMALATQRRREIELVRIDAALKRIDKDDYGYCASCDEDIAAGRLKSDPAEPLCVECATEARR
ncbi:MAG: TraR/DksA family transcriptional regulator [Rhodospirillaceae bacterium]|nr:TraR/DksA family transcriptional regulator [Rhodospirillaceae bacterium]MBT5240644.1 TraR/DksA family transcriptional regulator [Rhodospirillaceae bacterium]MBT5564479.1 TraR/DksA family transcriptional regulator [Rhodospirillaceae bacterium]MBT6089769.1 TraR/DksA family transcriptional regulator [Rhodospirillaceae bacterium]MBT7450348.1 TraR/DksA family transcriptional regulator [Rhodospirillaceae bacterium]